MFTACHPVLPAEQRVALTLRLIGGLTTAEIARAFLAPKRPSRSASCARSAPLPRLASASKCPTVAKRAARLVSVLEVLY
jgi:predicted RNA polymerase sigma factor